MDQLRWEIVAQQAELEGSKPNFEVADTIKQRGEKLLPRIAVTRPKEMNDQQYDEAIGLFRQMLGTTRGVQLEALGHVADLIESEIVAAPRQLQLDAQTILNGPQDEDELPWS